MASLQPGRALPTVDAAPPDAPYPSLLLPHGWRSRVTRRRLALAAVGAATYLLWLLATLPAALLVDRSERVAAVGGTVWSGEALLAGGQVLRWRWAPLRTLAHFAFAADFTVVGVGTEFGGRALVRRRSVRVDDVSGTGDAAILDALAPGLPFTCDMPIAIDIRRAEIGGGDQRLSGRVTGDAGGCRAKTGGATTSVPALALEAVHLGTASSGTVAPAGQRRRALVTFRLAEDGVLSLAVTRDGAAAFPFTAPPTGMTVDTRL